MSKSGIFPSDDWAVVEGETPTGPMFLRFRQGNPSEADRNLFNKLIIARWVFPPRDHTGLPNAELIEQMYQFETTIVDASDADGNWGSCVAVITHAGMRKWRFYTPDVDIFQHEFRECLRGLGPYPLRFEIFEDPEWNGLKQIRELSGSADPA